MSMLVPDVDEEQFNSVVVEGSSTRPVVVDFWATWCGPCTQLSPMLEAAAEQFKGQVDVVKVDVDANPRLAQQFGVQGIPAVKAFDNGNIVSEFTGVQPPATITQFFAALAPSEADQLVATAQVTGDADRRLALNRQAMDLEIDHPGAAVAIAADTDDAEEAAQVLAKARPTPEVLQAIAELKVSSQQVDSGELDDLRSRVAGGDSSAGVPLGVALAAAGEHGEAITVLLEAVRDPETRDEAREAILDVFTVLGNDSDLVKAARQKLAAALF